MTTENTETVEPASLDSQSFDAFQEALKAHAEGRLDENGRVVAAVEETEEAKATREAAEAEAAKAEALANETPEEKEAREAAEKVIADAAAAAEKDKHKGSVSERIRHFRRLATDAQEVADIEAAERVRLENRVKDLEAKLADPKAAKKLDDAIALEPGEPDPKDYKFGSIDPAYTRDAIKFHAEKTQKVAETSAAEAAAAREQTTKFEATVAKGLDKYDDYIQVVVEAADQGKWLLTPVGAQVIIDSEFGHEIAYHLAKNPAEAADIAEKPPHLQAAAIGRLEARFALAAEASKDDTAAGAQQKQQQDKKQVTGAPPPPPKHQSKDTAGKFTASPDTKDFSAYLLQVEKHKAAKGR